jgi:peroxiredoxin
VRVVGINLGEPAEHVKAYAAEMRVSFPVVIDTGGRLAQTYGVRFTPTHFLIDRRGIVRAGGSGSRDWDGDVAHAAFRWLRQPAPARFSP